MIMEVSLECYLFPSYYLMSMLFWNACGIGNVSTESHLRFLIHSWKLNLVAIAEPKISGARARQVCKNLGFYDCFREEAVGTKGGI